MKFLKVSLIAVAMCSASQVALVAVDGKKGNRLKLPDSYGVEEALSDNVLTLDEAVRLALVGNPDVLKAKEEIKRVHGIYVEVRAQALPQVAMTASYDIQDETLAGGAFGGLSSPNNEAWRVAFEGSQLLYSGGAVGGAINIAEYEQASTFYQLRDTVDRVIEAVRRQFYRVNIFRSLITVQQEALALLEKSLQDQKDRFDAGTVPKFNVLRAEVEVANQQPLVIRAKNNYRIALLELSKLLGVDYHVHGGSESKFRVEGELGVGPIPLGLDEAVALGVERRAFLKVQRQRILSEREQIKVAMAGYKPTLRMVGGYEWRSKTFSSSLDEYIDGWFFGVRGQWNVFDGLETKGKVAQARARLESALINYDDSVRQVQVEVQSAYSRLNEALELIDSQKKNIEQASEALRLAQERFDVGAGTQLDLLDARVAQTRARVTELEARFDYNSALAEFERVTGMDTVYDDTFDDPLAGKSAKWKARVGDQPESSDSRFEK